MIELLRGAAEEVPEQTAVITPDGEHTFRGLLEAAETAGAELVERGIERFAILEDDPATVLVLLAAASLTGAEACVYPLAANEETIGLLREKLDHDVLVTSRPGEGVLASAELTKSELPPLRGQPPESRPLLVLTTGTSGLPKGARHEWSRVLRVSLRIKPTPEHRWLLAYGLNQFGGLQILIHVLAARATLISARTFQPRDGLAAMRKHGVTHASGTPTFWRFLLSEIRGDGGTVPALRQVTLGGEAVPSALIDQLAATFPTAKISQIYGATEMGQNITVRDGVAGLPLSVLEEGGDVAFKVVDGELWVRSASSMLGYYGDEEIPDGGWRATGDLVEVVDDRIEFRGRTSEVINVGGVKVHPLPIEQVISRVEGVALVHAFGRPNAMAGNIVAVKVVPVAGTDTDDLDQRIRAACADLPPAARPRSIKYVDSMDTFGNKLSRKGPS